MGLGQHHGWKSVTDGLHAAIGAFITRHNADPKPFRWTKSADDILDSVARFCKRTSGTGH